MLSQRCRYALRALFELSKTYGGGPVKIGDVARAQEIPQRFLEVILGQLKHGGFVESRRGNEGGYMLARSPKGIRVGDIIRFVEGPIGPVECEVGGEGCGLGPACVFMPLWEKARAAMTKVYDGTTFADLVEIEKRRGREFVPGYAI